MRERGFGLSGDTYSHFFRYATYPIFFGLPCDPLHFSTHGTKIEHVEGVENPTPQRLAAGPPNVADWGFQRSKDLRGFVPVTSPISALNTTGFEFYDRRCLGSRDFGRVAMMAAEIGAIFCIFF